jgi:putative membrane protein
MDVHRMFSEADLGAVKRAVEEVEKKTSGEVVPYVVGASDDYRDAPWHAATLGILLAVLAAAVVHELGGYWGGWFAAWLLVPVIAGAALGFLAAAASPAVRRWMVDHETLEQRVRLRAESAFLREEVFRTNERTGVLVFLSLFERRVVILGDAGINAKVRQEEWDGIVAGMTAGIRAGRPAEALVAGIKKCGALLHREGVEIRPDDRDELSDELRIEDR